MAILPASALAIMLLVAAASDIRSRTIPNMLNLVIALSAPIGWWAAGLALWPDIAWQVGAAFALFAAFAALFAVGGIGGGDVKLIAALALWIDARLILSLLMVMAIVGGVISAVMIVMRRFKTAEGDGEMAEEVPYGVAIALAGLWAIYQQYINQFPLVPTN